MFGYNSLRFLYNYTLGFVYGPVKYEVIEAPIDLGYTLELLSRIQATNIFHDGYFNGDAHPGNILLLRDGRLGLIDYGQVKSMSVDERIIYAKLILAHSVDDVSEVVRIHFDEQKVKTKYGKHDIAYLLSAFYNDRNTEDVMGDRNIATFIDYLEAQDPMVSIQHMILPW